MTQAEAETLVAGQKIQYWDGRLATVMVVATPAPDEPGALPGSKIQIQFDAEPDPKPVYLIWSYDFIRAAPV